MMSKFNLHRLLNPVYALALASIFFIAKSMQELKTTPLVFHGFAENEETEINLDYDVEVMKIFVVPGQAVSKGDTLIKVKNIKLNQDIIHNSKEINIIRAEKQAWLEDEQNKIKSLELEKQTRLANLNLDIIQLKAEKTFQQKLWQGLKTIPDSVLVQTERVDEKIAEKTEEINTIKSQYEQEIKQLRSTLRSGLNPFNQEELKINSEIDYTNKRIEKMHVLAPHSGLVGNVHCSEGEFIDAFTALISYYEPNPTQVKAFVSENQVVQVNLGDTFKIIAIRDENLNYEGILVGLGSRIVEIPERMRKIPEVKSYGREVVIEIPPDNLLLQKEKVRLQPMSGQGKH